MQDFSNKAYGGSFRQLNVGALILQAALELAHNGAPERLFGQVDPGNDYAVLLGRANEAPKIQSQF
jgi:hypothetical protein